MTDAGSARPRRPAPRDGSGGGGWSRRRVLATAAAGGALAVAVPARLVAIRFDAQQGRPPIARGRGSSTSFGSVAVLAARRAARHDSGAHTHGGENAAGGPLPNL